jgi:hypothetical protein
MNRIKVVFLTILISTVYNCQAQIEVSRLQTKNFSSTGFGVFLHFDIPVSEANYLTLEGSLAIFKKGDHHIGIAPCLVGYRYTLDGTGTGFYVEPAIGYTFGGSDILKYDGNGYPLYNEDGSEVDQKVKGPTAALGGGYMLPSIPLTLGASYKFIKVANDPSLHVFSIRLSYSITFGRRDMY